LSCIVEYLSLT